MAHHGQPTHRIARADRLPPQRIIHREAKVLHAVAQPVQIPKHLADTGVEAVSLFRGQACRVHSLAIVARGLVPCSTAILLKSNGPLISARGEPPPLS